MKTGVILMGHGSPDSPEEVGEYLNHVLKRRPPAPEFIAEMEQRYRRIGGRSPLLDISRRQAAALSQRLGMPVFVGMRHWRPFIRETVEEARRQGIERLVGMPLAPQYARVSVGAYHAELQAQNIPCLLVKEWHLEPALIEYWRRVTQGKGFVLFTAHSIPIEGAEPYPAQLARMVKEIASGPHALAYQSRSPSPVPWLGPDITEVLTQLRGDVAVAPIGFISDHLEILYDLDILHRPVAERLGIKWERLPMPNQDPLLIEALASAVKKCLL